MTDLYGGTNGTGGFHETPPIYNSYTTNEIPMRSLKENQNQNRQQNFSSVGGSLGPSLLTNGFHPSVTYSQLPQGQIPLQQPSLPIIGSNGSQGSQVQGNQPTQPQPTQGATQGVAQGPQGQQGPQGPQGQGATQNGQQSLSTNIAAPGYIPPSKEKGKSFFAENKYTILFGLLVLIGLAAGGYYYWKYVRNPMSNNVGNRMNQMNQVIGDPRTALPNNKGNGRKSGEDEDDPEDNDLGDNLVRQTNRRILRGKGSDAQLRHKKQHSSGNKISSQQSHPSQSQQMKQLHDMIENMFTKSKQQDGVTKEILSQMSQLREDNKKTVDELRKQGGIINQHHTYISKIVAKLTTKQPEKSPSEIPMASSGPSGPGPASSPASPPPSSPSPIATPPGSQIPPINTSSIFDTNRPVSPASPGSADGHDASESPNLLDRSENSTDVNAPSANAQLVSPLFRAS